jgi:hypothetical protein
VMLDRLLAGTAASTDSASYPRGDILQPRPSSVGGVLVTR